ncbi:hypothetical protein CKAH01_00336 [Colletotrichum kahawae]|uniref:Uncharacterized protein n=1 Tax=Colletotrichum kahawae TaxID=34407 RepID=A0AAD9YUV9_COLKA|nr:hypothetical protein CKAH01_00336 [Colletotrichum kahawae]
MLPPRLRLPDDFLRRTRAATGDVSQQDPLSTNHRDSRIRITCCSLSTSQPLALRCASSDSGVSSIDCPGELLESRSRSRFNLLESSKLDAGGWKLA